MAKRLSEQEALSNLKELQNDYSFRFEGGYKSAKTKNLHVTCNHGHEYITYYDNFVSVKARCNQCANEKMSIEKRFNEQEALKVLYSLEPNYSFKFIDGYKNVMTKNLYITCNHGHEYISTYNNFVNRKARCPHCAGVAKLTEQEVLKNLKEIQNDYSFRFEGGYINNYSKNLHVICNKGHEYITSYHNFANKKRRCNQCANEKKSIEQRYDENEVLNNLKEQQNDYKFYFKGGYKNSYTKNLHVTCNHGHEYFVTYNNFRNGQRCPYCCNNKSKPETEIIDYIKSFYSKDIEQGNRTLIKNIHSGRCLELDIYIPDIKVAIEFNGLYWHSDEKIKEVKIGFTTAKEYHEYKTNQCKQLGINLIHIEEQEYIDNKDTILESIKNIITSY